LDKKAQAISKNTETALKKEKALRESLPPAVEKLNQEQEKALKAFGDTALKLEQAAQFQRDILNLGEEEARIRKTISEEAEKLKKAGLEITPEQEKRLRIAIQEEESVKRLIQLRREQSQAVFAAISKEGNAVEQALQKQLDFRLLMEGKTSAQVAAIREKEIRDNPQLRKLAEEGIDRDVQRAIDAEIGKGDRLYALQKRQQRDLQTLLDIERSAQVNNYKLSTDQIAALEVARTEMMKAQQLERIAFDKQIAEQRIQIELDRINRIMMAEKNAADAALTAEDTALLQRVGQQERQKKIVADRIEFEKKSDLEKAQFGIQAGAQLFSALGAQNKKAFEAAKAFNIANAVMNTYLSATKALATYPFPFGAIAAAGAVALGMAQVAQIRSQSYSGRALGGPVMGGTPYMVGESGPELFTPTTTGSITRNGDLGGGGPVNVTFNIMANDTAGFDDLLLSRRGLIRSVISDAMLESGRRG
jgi:hypothetical protein